MSGTGGKLALVKRAAALLLLLCFVLPLSKCEGRIDPDTGIRSADIVYYGFGLLAEFARRADSGLVERLMGLLAVSGVFALPLATLALRRAWEPIACLVGASLLHYPLLLWVFIAGDPMFGGLLTCACWLVILVVSLLQLWGYRKRRGAMSPAPT